MKLTNEMVVPASVDEAWAVMLDIERVAPCLPGASIEASEGDEYTGTMKLRLGPITSSFSGTIKIEEADEATHRAVLSARARDSRGKGTAAATITSTMAPADDGTSVTVETDLRVTGPAASFGRGVMQDVSARLMSEFAECLAAEMGSGAVERRSGGSEQPAAPVSKEGIELSGPLPPDVPEPPPTEATVRWPAGQPTADQREDLPGRADDEVLDLGAIGRQALVRRTVPAAAAGAAVLILIAAVLKRRGKSDR